jgi:hypothetical protein
VRQGHDVDRLGPLRVLATPRPHEPHCICRCLRG